MAEDDKKAREGELVAVMVTCEGKFVTVVVAKTVVCEITVFVVVSITTGSSINPAEDTLESILCSTTIRKHN